jgi:autotransporter passenger strand-loop-strand repeat protein
MTDTIVSSGQTSTGIVLNSGDTETVLSGGTASATAINAGGLETVSSGGLDLGATVNLGGTQQIEAGGTATGDAINSGGTQLVFGTASATTINSGGTQTISPGGLDLGAIVDGGMQIVEAGATALDGVVISSGTQRVFGTASGTTVSGRVSVQGTQIVELGGLAQGVIVSAATQIVEAGATASATVVTGPSTTPGFQDVFGTALGTTIDKYGTVAVESGGLAIGTVVSGPNLPHFNSFFADLVVSSGGVSSNAFVIGPTGVEHVLSGGLDVGATIGSAGGQIVYGSALGATILSAGAQSVVSGGVTIGTTIASGGTQSVNGTASATTINSGGTERVDFGGITVDTVIAGSGALLQLQLGAIVGGGVTFASPGGRLEIDGAVSPTYTVFGLDPTDSIDLADIGFDSGGTAAIGPDNILHVTQNGGSFDLQLDPTQDFTTTAFDLGMDQGAGTLVTALVRGQFTFSAGGFASANLGLNDGTSVAAPVAGAFNVEVFTALSLGDPLPVLDPGYQTGVIDPHGTTFDGFLAAAQVQLFDGDFLLIDLDRGINAPVQIFLGSGNQTVVGAAGDTLVGGSGIQVLVASEQPGAESIVGGTGAYTVFAGAGDTITANPLTTAHTTAQIIAGTSNLIDLTGDSGNVTVNALAGSDTVIAGSGNATVYGGAGDSIVGGAGGARFIDGSAGNMRIVVGAGGSDTIIGSAVAGAPDTIAGGAGTVNIWKLGSGDLVDFTAQIGAATVNAMTGNNLVLLGGGPATVYGGVGDAITCGSGSQYVDGSLGGMTIEVGAGGAGAVDFVLGAASGQSGNTIIGGSSSLVYAVRFNGGHDLIDLTGSTGNATINAFSAEGAEFLDVNDTIVAGFGSDSVWGGDGDRIGVGTSTAAGGTHLWGHSTTIAGAAIGFGTNDTVAATTYDTVNGIATVDATLPGASSARVTVGGSAGEFDTASDFLFYQFESAATNTAIVATSQTSDGGASSIITLPDGTVMTLLGVTQAELQGALLAGTLFQA